MDPLDIAPGDDESYEISDRPHVEIMFDALDDTMGGVTGSEGFGLTEAQRYAEGVLMANGALSARAVDGNESFFSAVGDGAKAIYDYIVKMFKNVWGFFFNRDVGKEVDAAKAEVKEDQKKLDGLKQATPEGVSDAKKLVAAARSADADTINLDTDTLDQIMTKLEGTPSEQKAGTAQLIAAMPKANKKAQAQYTKANTSVSEAKSRLIRVIEAAQKSPLGEPVTGVTGDVHEIGVSIVAAAVKSLPAEKAFITLLGKHKTIDTLNDATLLGAAILGNLDDLKALGERYKGHTARVAAEIKEAEADIKNATGHGATKDHVGKKRLDGLRNILTFATNIAQGIKKSIAELERLQKASGKIFGV